MEIVVDELKKKMESVFGAKVEIIKSPFDKELYSICIRAEALKLNNMFYEAISEYEKALILDSDCKDAIQGLATIHKYSFEYEKAIEYYERSIKLMPFDKVSYNEAALCCIKLNEPDKAKKLLFKAIKLDKEFIEAQFNLAICHEMLEEMNLALSVYNKIIEIRPSYIPAYNNLGSLYLREEYAEEALKMFKKILEINPEFSKAFLGCALAYDKMDCYSLAIKYYKKYLHLKPATDNAIYINDRLEDLAFRVNRKFSGQNHLKLVK